MEWSCRLTEKFFRFFFCFFNGDEGGLKLQVVGEKLRGKYGRISVIAWFITWMHVKICFSFFFSSSKGVGVNEAFSDCLLSRRERRQRRRFLKIEVVCVWAADDGTEVRKRKRRLTQIPIPRKERKISTYGQRRAGQTVCSIAGASRTAERISNQMRPVKTAPTACWARKKEKKQKKVCCVKRSNALRTKCCSTHGPDPIENYQNKKMNFRL